MNGTIRVPKSVLCYAVNKVRQMYETEVCYSNVSYVQNYLKHKNVRPFQKDWLLDQNKLNAFLIVEN